MTPLSRRQQRLINDALVWYDSMKKGEGTPLNHVPHIRFLLAEARVDATVLDPVGQHTAAEIERELDEALLRGHRMVEEAWRDAEHRRRPGSKPGRGIG